MKEEKYIELNTLLKLKGFASSGGQAKNLIRGEEVKVNGTIETRNKKKICAGDKVEIQGKIIILKEKEIQRKKE